MKPESKNHINFCQAVADGMTQTEAYKTYVSPKKSLSTEVAQVEGSKLAKKYAEHIQILRKSASAAIDKAHEDSAVKQALNQILTVAEVDAKLSTLITGGDVRAIDLYYKRFGHNAPTKNALTDKDGNDVDHTVTIIKKQ